MKKELKIPKSQRNQPHGQNVVIAERRLKTICLRRDCFTMREIADKLNCSVQTVSNDISHCLKELVQLNSAQITEMVALENERLDSLYSTLLPRALAGNLWACDRILEISKIRCKINGYDRIKHEITGGLDVQHTHSVDVELMARMRRLAGLSSESDPKNDEAKQIESSQTLELCADSKICQNHDGCNCK